MISRSTSVPQTVSQCAKTAEKRQESFLVKKCLAIPKAVTPIPDRVVDQPLFSCSQVGRQESLLTVDAPVMSRLAARTRSVTSGRLDSLLTEDDQPAAPVERGLMCRTRSTTTDRQESLPIKGGQPAAPVMSRLAARTRSITSSRLDSLLTEDEPAAPVERGLMCRTRSTTTDRQESLPTEGGQPAAPVERGLMFRTRSTTTDRQENLMTEGVQPALPMVSRLAARTQSITSGRLKGLLTVDCVHSSNGAQTGTLNTMHHDYYYYNGRSVAPVERRTFIRTGTTSGRLERLLAGDGRLLAGDGRLLAAKGLASSTSGAQADVSHPKHHD
ncbi:uncharacterized protein LOC126776173 [Nymphalis io]|uniref:uncharacterized protein LOC126776173 n=1 Tax=Inachis io TaxID=171585 RepID=UPI0021692B92|nr:uncharacterized protein LOC126776173 [Nymphalis io]